MHLNLYYFFLACAPCSNCSSAQQSKHGFQSHKTLAAVLIQPLVPPLTLCPGPVLTSRVEISRTRTGTHMESIGAFRETWAGGR